MSGKRKGARKTISLFIKAEQLKAIFWNIFFVQQWNNDQKEKIILASISQCNDIDSPLKWNCSVKNPSTITSLHFLLTLHFAPSLISQPWSFTRLRYIIYLSVFPAWLFFGPGVRGWNKADPVLKLTGSPKPEPEGSPPSPGLTEAASDKGAVCYELLRGKKKEHNREGYLVFLWPLKPSEMKRLSIFTRQGRPLQHRTAAWASKLSRNFNQRQITVYCEVYSAPPTWSEGAKGQKIAQQNTYEKRTLANRLNRKRFFFLISSLLKGNHRTLTATFSQFCCERQAMGLRPTSWAEGKYQYCSAA